MISLPSLPIVEALPALRAALISGRSAVVEAPPGAGKSTVIPLALLDQPWVKGRKLLMLEPRRLAARAVAERMAKTLGESVGDTVGYRMRLDTRVSRTTRIEVVTEGILTRMLQHDPSLEGVAAILFDEFHERSLQADLGLALCIDARQTLDLDLRLVVMSATLDGKAVATLLNDAPVITSTGRMYSVEPHYLGKGFPTLPGDVDSPERLTALAVQRAVRDTEGDILVFLPGAGEIRRVQDMLSGPGECSDRGVKIFPLFGELSPAEQDAALDDDPRLLRRVILATNIAETSLTLPKIRVVIDSGLVRRAVFDPVTGMSRLDTCRISRASAEQRLGRAGRVAAGHCYRLWSEGAHRSLAAQTPAEILEADLAPLALELAQWGATESSTLRWLDPPPAAMLSAAYELLCRLGLLNELNQITERGKEVADWPMHPRLALMLLEAADCGESKLGARLAALLSERDVIRASGERDTDIMTRLDVLDEKVPIGVVVDRASLSRIRKSASIFERRLSDRSIDKSRTAIVAAGLLAYAYPERIGRRRSSGDGRYLLANGRGAVFRGADRLARSEFIVTLDLDDRDREARILLAAALDRSVLDQIAGHRMKRESEVVWSSTEDAVIARDILRLDELVLEEKTLSPIPPEKAVPAIIAGIRAMGLSVLPWDQEARSFCARVELARRYQLSGADQWPSFDETSLLRSLEDWLSPWLEGVTRRSHCSRIPLMDALRYRLGDRAIRELDDLMPTHLTVPTGSRVRIDYEDDLAPCASMRMQEVFGLASTPRIGGDTVPVTFKLLSPAQRPLQITSDLESFWRNAYTEVRKDMRGRYPRHYWPEDPLQAEPTRKVRPRS
ncbi:MAG: ATP-dependent helicase HrpB [Gammaproteobacteria bacterium]